jgi:hypothetical protein
VHEYIDPLACLGIYLNVLRSHLTAWTASARKEGAWFKDVYRRHDVGGSTPLV